MDINTNKPTDFSDNFFTILYEDGDGKIHSYIQTCRSGEEVMYKAARVICFGDCSDEKVGTICADGVLVHYTGWQPGMVFTFADENENIVFRFAAPQWDH